MNKAVVAISVIVLVLLIGATLFYRHAVNKDFYFDEIKELVSQEAGYELQKTGPLEFSLFPRPVLTVYRLKISNPSAGRTTELAEVSRLSMVLHWAPLLWLQLEVDVEMVSPVINLEIDADGRENWMTEELLTVSGGLPFDLARIDTWGLKFLFKNHQKNEILGFDLEQFDLDLTEGIGNARIESAGRFGRSRFFAVGDAVYELDNKRLSLDLDIGAGQAGKVKVGAIQAPSVTQWIRQNAPLFPLRGNVRGAVSFENRMPTGELEVDATLASLGELSYLTEALALVRQDLGPVSVKGQLRLTGGDLDIEALDARLDHEYVKLYLTGNVLNLLSDIEAELKAEGEAEGLGFITDPGLAVPGLAADLVDRLGPIDVSASIEANGGDLIISDLDFGLAHKSFTARVSGDIHLLKEGMHLNIDYRSEAADSADLLRLFDLEPPKLADSGSLAITAKISGGSGKFNISNATGKLQGGNVKIMVEGEINLADQEAQIDLYSSVGINDVSRVVALLTQDVDPYLQDLTGTATGRITGTLADFAVRDLELELAREDRRLFMRGKVSRLPDKPAPDIEFHFTTESPVELEQYFPTLKSQQLTGPIDLVGAVRIAEDEIHINNLALRAEQTDLEGDVSIDLSADPPRIYAVFHSQQLLTRLVTREPDGEEDEVLDGTSGDDQSETEQQSDAAVREQDPVEAFKAYTAGVEIETEWIKDLDLYASFSAEKADIGDYNVSDLRLTIDAREGVFTLVEYQVSIEGRPVTFRGLVDANADPPVYAFSGEVQGDTLEVLLDLEEGGFVGGKLSGNFKLQSQGNTLEEVIANLDGESLVEMGPLGIRSNALNLFSSDLIVSMLKGITTKKKDQPTSKYDCAVLGIDVKKGIARMKKSFAMQAKDYNLAGGGKVDLNTGYVDVAVFPKARKGLGFSVSKLVGGFRIKGHMATPDFGLTGGGFLTALIAGYAFSPTLAKATNPAAATILVTGFVAMGIFDRLTARNYTCKNTLKRIESNRARVSKTRSSPRIPKWQRWHH